MIVPFGREITTPQAAYTQIRCLQLAGCDSIVTLNLTIHNAASSDTTATACDSLVWRGVTFTNSGTYYDTLQTQTGCDSVITLNLTINSTPTFVLSSDTISQCNVDSILLDAGTEYSSYAWSNGVNTQQTFVASNGFYTVTITDANGCSAKIMYWWIY